jgi:hypothetical protein
MRDPYPARRHWMSRSCAPTGDERVEHAAQTRRFDEAPSTATTCRSGKSSDGSVHRREPLRVIGGGRLDHGCIGARSGGIALEGRTQRDSERGVDKPVRTLVEVWDGTAWQVQPSPDPRGFAAILSAVSCTSASACTAVGDDAKGSHSHVLSLAERWNGSVWTIERTADPKDSTTNILSGVSCSGAMHRTAVGTGNGTLAEIWDGSAWTIQPTPNPPDGFGLMALSEVACVRSTACTAVGLYFKRSGGPVTLAEGWNGSSWEIQPTPKLSGSSGYGLYAIACGRIHTCIAVGFRGAKTLAEGR